MTKGIQRREFFKALAIGGVTVAAAGCTDVPENLIPYQVRLALHFRERIDPEAGAP